MAEETKVEEKKTEEPVVEEKKEEAEPVVEKQVDPDMEAIMADVDKLKKDGQVYKEKADKYDSVAQAVTGQSPQNDEEKFIENMTKDGTKKSIEDLINKKTEGLEKQIADQKLKDADTQAFAKLRTQYPDIDGMIADASKYLTQEEINSTESMENRTEMRLALIASRRKVDVENKKTSEANAMNKAKEDSNKANVIETPTGGGDIPDAQTELQKELSEAKKNFDSDKVIEILANDLWEISKQRIVK